jgi:hypothetical protein
MEFAMKNLGALGGKMNDARNSGTLASITGAMAHRSEASRCSERSEFELRGACARGFEAVDHKSFACTQPRMGGLDNRGARQNRVTGDSSAKEFAMTSCVPRAKKMNDARNSGARVSITGAMAHRSERTVSGEPSVIVLRGGRGIVVAKVVSVAAGAMRAATVGAVEEIDHESFASTQPRTR